MGKQTNYSVTYKIINALATLPKTLIHMGYFSAELCKKW